MLVFAHKYLTSPVFVLSSIALISAASLMTAYIAQYIFGLEPCVLCLYQRLPFALAILISIFGLALMRWKARAGIIAIAICAPIFLTNSVIAFYHSGIERHWWKSAVKGCSISFGDNPDSLLESIMNAPTAHCDEIPWADPLLGLSMANYNILLCFDLFAFCLLSLTVIKYQKSA